MHSARCVLCVAAQHTKTTMGPCTPPDLETNTQLHAGILQRAASTALLLSRLLLLLLLLVLSCAAHAAHRRQLWMSLHCSKGNVYIPHQFVSTQVSPVRLCTPHPLALLDELAQAPLCRIHWIAASVARLRLQETCAARIAANCSVAVGAATAGHESSIRGANTALWSILCRWPSSLCAAGLPLALCWQWRCCALTLHSWRGGGVEAGPALKLLCGCISFVTLAQVVSAFAV